METYSSKTSYDDYIHVPVQVTINTAPSFFNEDLILLFCSLERKNRCPQGYLSLHASVATQLSHYVD